MFNLALRCLATNKKKNSCSLITQISNLSHYPINNELFGLSEDQIMVNHKII